MRAEHEQLALHQSANDWLDDIFGSLNLSGIAEKQQDLAMHVSMDGPGAAEQVRPNSSTFVDVSWRAALFVFWRTGRRHRRRGFLACCWCSTAEMSCILAATAWHAGLWAGAARSGWLLLAHSLSVLCTKPCFALKRGLVFT